MKNYLFLFLASTIFSANACKKNDSEAENPPEKGYVTGKAVDSKGNPLANVEVSISNRQTGNPGNKVVTDKNGNYKLQIKTPGVYHVSAYITRTFNGIEYYMPLHPDNNEDLSQEGGVKNFQWKLTGTKPEGGTYGGSVEISADLDINDIEDAENMEFTFTPTSKLIDGTEGVVMKRNPTRVSAYFALLDIPVASYTVSATYKGQVLRLKIRDSDAPYQNTVNIRFPGTLYSGVALSYNY